MYSSPLPLHSTKWWVSQYLVFYLSLSNFCIVHKFLMLFIFASSPWSIMLSLRNYLCAIWVCLHHTQGCRNVERLTVETGLHRGWYRESWGLSGQNWNFKSRNLAEFALSHVGSKSHYIDLELHLWLKASVFYNDFVGCQEQ